MVTQKRHRQVSCLLTCPALKSDLKKWMFAASVEVRPLEDKSGLVIFDEFASQTLLLRFSPNANSAMLMSESFTADDAASCFGKEATMLDVLISRKLVVPVEH